ncbi:hypothetical protein HYPSUDRAFT_208777 [Hypholoma sublateritium FD-334 SS-4]|uniref:Uncharacterized protein n=1 Tax=Hypholoma sublateritium (strain FD-334 SS-4) TaxID=945553 RepID=A0A0D2P135_HYPSF|nr:hypothetical protein HYPSUDRAFT_208777 [Hypholoma sublateritium FD-334 SS-4]
MAEMTRQVPLFVGLLDLEGARAHAGLDDCGGGGSVTYIEALYQPPPPMLGSYQPPPPPSRSAPIDSNTNDRNPARPSPLASPAQSARLLQRSSPAPTEPPTYSSVHETPLSVSALGARFAPSSARAHDFPAPSPAAGNQQHQQHQQHQAYDHEDQAYDHEDQAYDQHHQHHQGPTPTHDPRAHAHTYATPPPEPLRPALLHIPDAEFPPVHDFRAVPIWLVVLDLSLPVRLVVLNLDRGGEHAEPLREQHTDAVPRLDRVPLVQRAFPVSASAPASSASSSAYSSASSSSSTSSSTPASSSSSLPASSSASSASPQAFVFPGARSVARPSASARVVNSRAKLGKARGDVDLIPGEEDAEARGGAHAHFVFFFFFFFSFSFYPLPLFLLPHSYYPCPRPPCAESCVSRRCMKTTRVFMRETGALASLAADRVSAWVFIANE